MSSSRWRLRSRRVIEGVLLEAEAQAVCLGHSINHDETIKAISKAYPFVERKYYPYKVWLSEVKKAKDFLKLGWEARLFDGYASKLTRSPKQIEVTEGQMSLDI